MCNYYSLYIRNDTYTFSKKTGPAQSQALRMRKQAERLARELISVKWSDYDNPNYLLHVLEAA
jgi:hypothetical protein